MYNTMLTGAEYKFCLNQQKKGVTLSIDISNRLETGQH